MEKSGVGLFHGFPGASFPQRTHDYARFGANVMVARAAEDQILLYRKPRKMPTSSDSCVEPFFVSDVDNDVKLFGGVS